MANMRSEHQDRAGKARLLSAADDWNPTRKLRFNLCKNPLPNCTLGDVDLAAQVKGPADFPLTMIILPFDAKRLDGIEPTSITLFRVDPQRRDFRPIWNSGINVTERFIWGKVTQPGTYVAIGLPRDRLLQSLLLGLAKQRAYLGCASAESSQAATMASLEPWLKVPVEALEQARKDLARLEASSSLGGKATAVRGAKGAVLAYPLPRGATVAAFRERINKLQTPTEGLPEERLFSPPAMLNSPRPPWPMTPAGGVPRRNLNVPVTAMPVWTEILSKYHFPICWLFSQDWWMFHANERHTGNASGCSEIDSLSVKHLGLWAKMPVSGTIQSTAAIVGGKAYIGTANSPTGGTLYKIDLFTATVEHTFGVPSAGGGVWGTGVGCSPSVVNDRVYFSALDGHVYCLKATDLSFVWSTDLRNPDPAKGQYVNNSSPGVGCWPSPLVVNGKVYVGVGLGEDGGTLGAAFGFVYCLSAQTGQVNWLFCTNKFSNVADNSPNDIPHSLLSTNPPAPFTRHGSDPPARGASVWSSLAYSWKYNRVYFGTGNPYPDHPLPNEHYSSGAVALDADTGQIAGFFQPSASDSYRPLNDDDVDVPSSPVIFRRNNEEVLGIGSKNGGFFLLDAGTMQPLGKRQLLPYYNDDATQPIPSVDPEAVNGPGENHSGVYGSPAVHFGSKSLFVGLGGWLPGGGDYATTPFVRALKWDNSLADSWPLTVGPDHVRRYTNGTPPFYTTPDEVSCSSPAVVNDVVFVATSKSALYAFDVHTGVMLWTAPGISEVQTHIVGPSISGDYVVCGSGSNFYIYRRLCWIIPPWWIYQLFPQLPWQQPWPPPPPPPPEGWQEMGP